MEKQVKTLLSIIKITPPFIILIISMLVINIMNTQQKKELQEEHQVLEEQFIIDEKERINANISTVYHLIKDENKNIEIELKNKLKYDTDNVYKIMNAIYDENIDTKSKKEIVKMIKTSLKNIRFNQGRTYISLSTLNYIKVMQPLKPENEGDYTYNLQDKKGKYLMREVIALAKSKKGEGYVDYYFTKFNGSKKEYKKISYIKLFKKLDLVIVIGDYVDDFKVDIQNKMLKQLPKLKYKKGSHLYIITFDGDIIYHPSDKAMNTNIFKEDKYNHMDYLFKNLMLKEKKDADVFINIRPRVTEGIETKDTKINYVKRFDDWNWMIGSNFNISDSNKIIEKRKKMLSQKYQEYKSNILFYGIIFTIIMLIFSYFMSKVLEKKFLRYKDNLEDQIMKNETQRKTLIKAQEIAHLGSWEQSSNEEKLYWSKEIYTIFELDRKIDIDFEQFINIVHPDDRESVSKTFKSSMEKHKLYYLEHRLLFADGRIKYVIERAEHYYDKNNKYIKTIGTVQDITEKKELELKLEESYNTLQKLSDNIPGCVYQYKLFLDGSSKFTYVSKGMEKVYEVSPKDALLNPNNIEKYTYSEDVDMFVSSIKESVEKMKEWNLEYRVDLPTKGLRWLHAKSKPEKLDDGSILWHGYVSDITEEVEYREKLKSQSILLKNRKKELETIIQENPHPMILHSEGGKVIMINRAWFKSSGFSIDDTPTINDWIELTREDEEAKNFIKKHIDSLYEITETLDEGEFTFFNKNRDKITWQVSSSPLGIMDGNRTIITSAVDITDMREKEQILFQQSKMAAMGEMLGNIAHQWRQPLSVISTSATGAKAQNELGLLNKINLNSYFETINNSAQYLSHTIDDFRGFFNPNNNLLTKFKVSHTLTKTLNLVSAQFIEKDIEIIENLEDFELLSKENEMIQVLINVLNNARDALLISENQRRLIFISAYKKEDISYIEILDNAGGINKDIIERVFEPYFTTKHKLQGTGIGLYMSEQIVKNHLSGNLTVLNQNYSYEGVDYTGAKFTIKLGLL